MSLKTRLGEQLTEILRDTAAKQQLFRRMGGNKMFPSETASQLVLRHLETIWVVEEAGKLFFGFYAEIRAKEYEREHCVPARQIGQVELQSAFEALECILPKVFILQDKDLAIGDFHETEKESDPSISETEVNIGTEFIDQFLDDLNKATVTKEVSKIASDSLRAPGHYVLYDLIDWTARALVQAFRQNNPGGLFADCSPANIIGGFECISPPELKFFLSETPSDSAAS